MVREYYERVGWDEKAGKTFHKDTQNLGIRGCDFGPLELKKIEWVLIGIFFIFLFLPNALVLVNVLSMKNMGLGPQSEEELAYDK